MLREFNSLSDLVKAFPDEKACIDHFRELRWPNGITCPHCGVIGEHYTLKDQTHKCRDCGKKFSVRHGTIFEDSKLGLQKWFMAIFLMTSHKKGISSCQLARDIGITQKAAWFVLHRIRNAAATREFQAPLTGTVEVDECYVGGNPRFRHARKRLEGVYGGAAARRKKIMFGMLQRGGDLRLAHVPGTKKATLKPIIQANIKRGSRVHSDEGAHYLWMRSSYAHAFVAHTLGEYTRRDGTTNRVEGAFSHFKRAIIGVYHKASDQHLDRYLQMFAYRWNRRDMEEGERVNDLLQATKGRRLSYKKLIAKES